MYDTGMFYNSILLLCSVIQWTFVSLPLTGLLSDSNWRENHYNRACFIQTKFCVWAGKGTKFIFWIKNMTNYYLFTLKLLFESEMYSTFQVIYMINIVVLLQCCWQPIKGYDTSIKNAKLLKGIFKRCKCQKLFVYHKLVHYRNIDHLTNSANVKRTFN